MAIVVQSGADTSQTLTPADDANYVHSTSFTLTGTSANNRMVIMSVSAWSAGSTNKTVGSGPTYAGNSASGSIGPFFDTSGGDGNFHAIYYWLDAVLPSTATAHTMAITINNAEGNKPSSHMHVVELNNVDQTTPVASSSTTSNFGTGARTQTLLSDVGDFIWASISGGNDAAAGETPNGGTGLSSGVTDNGGGQMAYRKAYSTSGTISMSLDADYASESCGLAGINEATGLQTLTASKHNDADTFFTHTASPGAVTPSASLHVDSDVHFTHSIDSLYTATQGIHENPDVFFTHDALPGGVTPSASLFVDTDVFFTHDALPGGVTPSASLFVDTDVHFTHSIESLYSLTQGIHENSHIFFTHSISTPAVDEFYTSSQHINKIATGGTVDATSLGGLLVT